MEREKYEDQLKIRIRDFRDKHKLSGRELSAVTEMQGSNLSAMLNGGGRTPSVYMIRNLCKEYGVSADHFVCDDFPEETHAAHDICSVTGLSEPAANMLQTLASDPGIYGKQVINCINMLLEAVDPDHPLESVLYDIYGYICSDFALVDDHFSPDLEGLQIRATAPDGSSAVRDLDPIKQDLFRIMYQENLLQKLKKLANKK